MADENKGKATEAKQGAITPADLTSPKKLRVAGFSGSYKGIVFESGESLSPVPKDVEDELRAQFPNASIEEVADKPAKK